MYSTRLRPRPHVSGYFRVRNFFFPDTATVHTYPANSAVNPKKKNRSPEWKKNKSATNPITCGRVNPDILLSDDVKSVSNLSPNNKPIWRHNVGGWTEQISRHYLALRRMLWRPFSAEEPWVLEWIRIPSHTCGQGNFWIRKEKVADSKISGYVWTGESG